HLELVEPVLTAAQVAEYQQTVRQVHVEEPLIRYVAQIIYQTRDHSALYLGASPRASIALMTGAKALSAMRGRDFITPEDIQEIAYPVLRHRILLTPEQEMEGRRPDDVIKGILERIDVPR
ncbi:MAG: AAA family ATPase, partial [Rhodothermales bacterium]